MNDFQFERPDTSGIAARAKAIITSPSTEWPKVAAETTPPGKVLMTYALPLALIGPVAALIGGLAFGMPTMLGTLHLGITALLTMAVMSFVLAIISLYVVSWAANFLSPKFNGRDDFPAAFRLVAYSMTASWLAGIFGLVPWLSILSILGLYSLFLFYKGATPVLGVPADKAGFYTVVTVVVAIIVNVVAAMVLSAIAAPAIMAGANVAASGDQATVSLPGLGKVTVDGKNQSVDMGKLGKVEVNGENGTVTVDGQTVTVDVKPTDGD
ncbi:MAG: hypothetical protein RLZZ08_1670 [Pseudomonadota bacterium]|jgi:type IV secretory pathway VirB3-like protein